VTEEQLAELWESIHQACCDLEINVVTGHTGRYDGCGFPMVGGSTVFAIGSRDAYVTVGMTRPDDAIVVTKGAAIEAAGLMAVTFGDRLERAFGQEFAARAKNLFWQMSTVEDSLTAASVGLRDAGVTAMHDATECGVLGGLYEMAHAASVGMDVDVAAIPVQNDIAKICQHFGMDPYTSISEGTLLLTCRPHRTTDVLKALADKGILAAQVGTCSAKREVRLRESGATRKLDHPRIDPFWEAFARAASEPQK